MVPHGGAGKETALKHIPHVGTEVVRAVSRTDLVAKGSGSISSWPVKHCRKKNFFPAPGKLGSIITPNFLARP